MVKMNYAARTMLSFFSFNMGWWACALGTSHSLPWLGPALLPLFLGLHLYYSPVPKGEFLFLAILGVLGFAIDSILLRLGLFTLVPLSLYAPLWLVAMWILLGQTYESMLMMRKNKYLLCLSGGLSGPLSYYCFEALGILSYARPLWLMLTLHGMLWAVLTPVLFLVRDSTLHLTGVVPSVLVVPTVPLAPPSSEVPPVVAPQAPGYSREEPTDPDKS
jgi:hypothetical protein